MLLIIGCGMLVGLGLLVLLAQLVPTQPQLKHALDRLHPDQLRQALTDQTPAPPTTGKAALGAWAERHLGHRIGLGVSEQDLSLLGKSSRQLWAEKASGALAGLLAIPVLTGAVALLGVGITPAIPASLGLGLALLGWLLPVQQARTAAATARAEFVRATIAYLQLVAIKRATGAGITNTMTDAAAISSSWVFRRIQQELTKARWAHVQAWDALVNLGRSTGIKEITEVGDIMRLAGESGAGVSGNLLARAEALQSRLLSEEHGAANAATTRMAAPIACIVVVFVLAMLYPVLMTLLSINPAGG